MPKQATEKNNLQTTHPEIAKDGIHLKMKLRNQLILHTVVVRRRGGIATIVQKLMRQQFKVKPRVMDVLIAPVGTFVLVTALQICFHILF